MKTLKTLKYQTSDGHNFTSKEAATRRELQLKLAEICCAEGQKLTGQKIIEGLMEQPQGIVNLLVGLELLGIDASHENVKASYTA